MFPTFSAVTSFFDRAADVLSTVSDHLYGDLLAWLLIATGVWFTIRTRAVQLRLFRQMLRAIMGSRVGGGGISSFQAFTIGLASRVGTGNIVGVALAITLGGPGAVFWMWVVAFVGMSTGFVEAVLAQLYKVRHPEGTFRGGPAYYISRGLGSRLWASIFAVVITFVFGFAYEATQANAISGVMTETFGVDSRLTAIGLVLVTTPVVFGGITAVARIAEWMAPLMAGVYALLALVVLLLNAQAIPGALASIFEGAFGLDQAFAGVEGGIIAAALNGIKRGLFSNEAGEGSVPNAAATATVSHPVQQGLIQSFGVFVDTIVVCTATAFVILIAGAEVWGGRGVNPSNLTTLAVSRELGAWTIVPMAVLVFVLAYSSIIAAYVYSDTNMSFVFGGRAWATWVVRVVCVASATAGALLSLDVVWNAVDIAMAVMTITNLIALVILMRWGLGALRDYQDQRRAGIADPVFVGEGNPLLPRDVPGRVWKRPKKSRARKPGSAG